MTDLITQQYEEGYHNGVDHVMRDLNDMCYDIINFPDLKDREIICKVYDLLYKNYPEKL